MYLSIIKMYFDHLQYARNICHLTSISTQQSTNQSQFENEYFISQYNF